jgi:hypothetical protein
VGRWPQTVGEAIARNAWPSRIARDGTLHVSTTDSIWAFELGHRATEIATRLGVASVRFAPGPVPRDVPAPPPRPPLGPTPEQEAEAAEIVAPIEHDEVRRSVQTAVLSSLVRGSVDRSL